MRLNNFRLWVGLGSVVLLVFATAGCGSSSQAKLGTPQTALSQTQNPLVAQYQVNQFGPAQVWVEFGTDTSYGRQTAPLSTSSQSSTGEAAAIFTNQLLVAGMKPSTTYHMRAHVDYADGSSWVEPDRTFTTGPLPMTSTEGGDPSGTQARTVPLTLPTIAITRPTPGMPPSPGAELFSLVEPAKSNMLRAFVTDLDGNVIWYYDPGPNEGDPTPIKLLPNGHFIINVNELREIDLAGNTIRDITFQEINQALQAAGYSFNVINFHHDMLVLPNGHWIALCNVTKDFTNLPGYPGTTHMLGDALVDIDPSGAVVWAWSGFDYLDVNRHPAGLVDFEGLGADWTHSNALIYTSDGDLLLSMRNQSWILKIDYQNGAGTGDILWRLGEGGDFALAGGDPTQWFYGQHDPNTVTDNGSQLTLAIWDNGNYRIDSTGQACGTTTLCYSRATIFEIDQTARVANVLWQDLPGAYDFWGGSIAVLPNGNVEFDQTSLFGLVPASRISEVTQTPNPQTVWRLDLTGENAYRATRIPSLYPGVTWK